MVPDQEDAAYDKPTGNAYVTVTVPEEDIGFWGNHRRRLGMCCKHTKDNALLIGLLMAVVMGTALGFGVRSTGYVMTKREIMYLMFPGEMLMRMLRMLILPLIMSSLISGIAGLDATTCGRMGLRTIAYFTTTTLLAVILGIIMAMSIKPGGGTMPGELAHYGEAAEVNSVDTFLDLIRNMFPDNLVEACFNGYKTKEKKVAIKNISDYNTTDFPTTASNFFFDITLNFTGNLTNETTPEEPTHTMDPVEGKTKQMNVLGLVVFSLATGIVLGRMGAKGKPLIDFCMSLNEVIMKLFIIFIWYSPIGIMFLIAGKIVGMEDFGILLGKIGLYFMTVLLGLFIHGVFILPALYFVCTRLNPFKFIYGILQALATAFGTSSSSATLPVTLHCLENNLGIDPRVCGFVIPVGATINMDGTALYEAVAALFIAQVNNIDLDFGQIVTVSITATVASIGAAGVPQAGLITMVIVLAAVGLPVEDSTLVVMVDWFLDRFRTMTNVLGDSLGAGIVYHLGKNEMPPMPLDETEMATSADKVPNGTEGAAITAV